MDLKIRIYDITFIHIAKIIYGVAIFFKLYGTSFQTLTPLYLRDLCKRLDRYLGKYNILLSDEQITRK